VIELTGPRKHNTIRSQIRSISPGFTWGTTVRSSNGESPLFTIEMQKRKKADGNEPLAAQIHLSIARVDNIKKKETGRVY
jgi:hypothetical protein